MVQGSGFRVQDLRWTVSRSTLGSPRHGNSIFKGYTNMQIYIYIYGLGFSARRVHAPNNLAITWVFLARAV